jgi:hypothetical protein
MISNSKDILIIIAQRLWQAVSGFGTLVFIMYFMSLDQQGWYYSLLSLSALYTLFELGLSVILVNVSAKYFIGLTWTKQGGLAGAEQDTFAAMVPQALVIYALLALAFTAIMTPIGVLFFQSRNPAFHDAINGQVNDWYSPWVALVLANACNLMIFPFLSIVEGAYGLVEAYKVRLVQAVLGSFLCWSLIVQGHALWAAIGVPLMSSIVGIGWLLIWRRGTLQLAFPKHSRRFYSRYFSWRANVWPLQWRAGLSWLSSYLLTGIFTPFVFYFKGAEAAGRLGLSLTLAHMVGIIIQSWMARRAPAMVRAAHDKNWGELDLLFKRGFQLVVVLFCFAICFLCVAHIVLEQTAYANRVLSFNSFIELLLIVFIGHITGAMALQLRSFLVEPLAFVNLFCASLTCLAALLALYFGGLDQMITAILTTQLFVNLPWVYLAWRKSNLLLRI